MAKELRFIRTNRASHENKINARDKPMEVLNGLQAFLMKKIKTVWVINSWIIVQFFDEVNNSISIKTEQWLNANTF